MDKEHMLIETTLSDLERSIEIGFPNTTKRQHIFNQVQITGMRLVPYVGMRTLNAMGTVSSNGNTYNPTIVFLRVVFEPDETDQNVTFKASDGKMYNVQPIEKDLSNIKVRCNCLDYYYRFSYTNRTDGSHQPPNSKPYVRRTDNYPPANPLKVPGVCKHILKLADYLEKTDIIA